MGAPILDQGQRKAGYAKSLELRQARAELKNQLRRTYPPVCFDLFKAAFDLEQAQGMKVYRLLLCLRNIGPTKAKALLEQAGIPEGNTVRACGPKQRAKLFELLTKR